MDAHLVVWSPMCWFDRVGFPNDLDRTVVKNVQVWANPASMLPYTPAILAIEA